MEFLCITHIYLTYLQGPSLCEKVTIFLPLKFYVKSIFFFQEKQKATNPFAAAPEPAGASDSNTPNILDLFGVSAPPATAGTTAPPTVAGAPAASGNGTSTADKKSSDDLLQLAGNPFASVLNSSNTTSASTTSNSQNSTGQLAFSSSPFAAPTAGSNGRDTYSVPNLNIPLISKIASLVTSEVV